MQRKDVIVIASISCIYSLGNPQDFKDMALQLTVGEKYGRKALIDKLITILSATKIEKEERSVISALTLGYRTELDPETMDYFVNTGTIHVLSVSGLHVALIFIILSFLLSGINRGKVGAFIYPVIMILFLWI